MGREELRHHAARFLEGTPHSLTHSLPLSLTHSLTHSRAHANDSWKTDIYWERSFENFMENAQRFIRGESLIAEVTSCVDAVSSNKALRF